MEEQSRSNNGFMQTLKRNRWPLLLTFFTTSAIVLFLYFFYGYATDIGPEQPIPFSHQVHVGVKQIQCEFCHPYVKYSNHPGLPPVEKCLYCHKYIIANHPWIQEEHRYFNTKTPTPWQGVMGEEALLRDDALAELRAAVLSEGARDFNWDLLPAESTTRSMFFAPGSKPLSAITCSRSPSGP